MPRFKQNHPKQIPNLMQNFCVMTSHIPKQLPNITSQLNDTSSSDQTSSTENQTNSEAASSSSGAEIESMSSSNNCITKKEIEMTSSCSQEYLKTKTENKTKITSEHLFYKGMTERAIGNDHNKTKIPEVQDQTEFTSRANGHTPKYVARKYKIKTQQQQQSFQHTNDDHLPTSQLQKFSLANPFLYMSKQTNSVSRIQALYESQIKWACLNNFYNQRRQQLMYAACMVAQNNSRHRELLQSQQKFSNYVRPHQNLDNHKYNRNKLNVNIQTNRNFYQSKHEKHTANKVRSNTTKKNQRNALNKNHTREKMIASTKYSQHKHVKPHNTNVNELKCTPTTNNKKEIEHMQAMIADFSNKSKTCSSTKDTLRHPDTLQTINNSSDVISINIQETYKSSGYLNLPTGRISLTNNQVIVTEKQAEMIINQVKEEMRGRDPENMYIKCPLCEKRIKRLYHFHRHMRIHLGKKDHKCPHCDYSSVRKDNLKSHMKTHDKINNQTTTRKRTTPTSDLPALLNHKRFKSSRFTNVDTNRIEPHNHSIMPNNQGNYYAPNGLYPHIRSSLNSNTLPQQYSFTCDQIATVKNNRHCEEKFDKNCEKITDINEKQWSCKLKRSEEEKTVYKQNLSSVTEKHKNKLVNLFRPYEDMNTKGC